MMAAEVEIEPTDCDWKGGVGTHCHEEESAVFEMCVFVSGEEDCKACNRHGNRDESKEETMFQQIGEVSYDQRKYEGGGPRRH